MPGEGGHDVENGPEGRVLWVDEVEVPSTRYAVQPHLRVLLGGAADLAPVGLGDDVGHGAVIGAVDEDDRHCRHVQGWVRVGPGARHPIRPGTAQEGLGGAAAEVHLGGECQVDAAGEADCSGQAVRPGLGRGEGDEMTARGVADEEAPVGQRRVCPDSADGCRDVLERPRPAATRHTSAAVLHHRDVVTGVREALRLGARVLPVPLPTPEAAVDDHHRRT